MLELTGIINYIDLTDIYKTFYPTKKEYTFFRASNGTFSKINHINVHKPSLNKYEKYQNNNPYLSEHCVLKLDIKTNKNKLIKTEQLTTDRKYLKTVIEKEIKDILKLNEN